MIKLESIQKAEIKPNKSMEKPGIQYKENKRNSGIIPPLNRNPHDGNLSVPIKSEKHDSSALDHRGVKHSRDRNTFYSHAEARSLVTLH